MSGMRQTVMFSVEVIPFPVPTRMEITVVGVDKDARDRIIAAVRAEVRAALGEKET